MPAAPPMAGYPASPMGQVGPSPAISYTVPSVGFSGPARFGAALSALFMLLPCLIFAFGGAWAVHEGRELLDSWVTASIRIPIPIAPINLPMNFIDLLNLKATHDRFIYWDDRLWLVFATLWLIPWALWIVAGAVFGLLFGGVYNLMGSMGGGIRVKLTPADIARSGSMAPPPPTWGPGPTPSAPGGWPSQGGR